MSILDVDVQNNNQADDANANNLVTPSGRLSRRPRGRPRGARRARAPLTIEAENEIRRNLIENVKLQNSCK